MESKKKTIIIRKKIPNTQPSVKITPKKIVRISKRLSNAEQNLPLPNTMQEDFMLESEEFPVKFLQSCHSDPKFELLNREKLLTKKKSTLSPTEVIGSYKSFKQKAKIDDMELAKKFTKFQFRRMVTKKVSVDLDEKIKAQKNSIHYPEFEGFSPQIKTPGAKLVFAKQERTLKRFEKQREYWQSLESEISDKLKKNPEELSFNSWKPFATKMEQLENQAFLEMFNKKSENKVWKMTLREEDLLRNNPNISPRYLQSAEGALRYSKGIIKYASTPDYEEIRARLSPLFQGSEKVTSGQEKALRTQRVLEKSRRADIHEFVVEGHDKLMMEYWAAKKAGAKYVRFNKPEPMAEQLIEGNYDPKVLY